MAYEETVIKEVIRNTVSRFFSGKIMIKISKTLKSLLF